MTPDKTRIFQLEARVAQLTEQISLVYKRDNRILDMLERAREHMQTRHGINCGYFEPPFDMED